MEIEESRCGDCAYRRWSEVYQAYVCVNLHSPLSGEEVGENDGCIEEVRKE